MQRHEVPERAQHLILEAIDSVAELEALLLLRETAGQRWTVDAAGARLYVSAAVAARWRVVGSSRRRPRDFATIPPRRTWRRT